MFCKSFFAPIFFIFILSQPSQLEAMHRDGEVDEYNHKNCITQQATPFKNKAPALKNDNLTFIFAEAPEEIVNEIFSYLKSNEVLLLRETSKKLKDIVDRSYWKNHVISINNRSSSPAIQDVKDIPCSHVSLAFNRWEEKDIEQLLDYKHATHLRLVGLNSWNFSAAELFNPYLVASCMSCILSIINIPLFSIFGVELGLPTIFLSVTSLDLSKSNIGDYGVISFVSHFKKLQILNISHNDIGRNIIGEANAIANLHSLTSLNISRNHFSSETVRPIAKLKNLTSLDISYNYIGDNSAIKQLSLFPKEEKFIYNNQIQKNKFSNGFPIFFNPDVEE